MDITVGRTVLYILSPQDADQINRRRTTGHAIAERIASTTWPLGAQAHIGNHAQDGDVFPLVVVRVWPREYGDAPGVNGQVLLDGNDTLWVVSVKEGTTPGTWQWPPRV